MSDNRIFKGSPLQGKTLIVLTPDSIEVGMTVALKKTLKYGSFYTLCDTFVFDKVKRISPKGTVITLEKEGQVRVDKRGNTTAPTMYKSSAEIAGHIIQADERYEFFLLLFTLIESEYYKYSQEERQYINRQISFYVLNLSEKDFRNQYNVLKAAFSLSRGLSQNLKAQFLKEKEEYQKRMGVKK